MALALYMTFNTWADGLSLRNSRRNLYISHIAAKWMSATESISMSAMATYSNNAVANNSFKPTQLRGGNVLRLSRSYLPPLRRSA